MKTKTCTSCACAKPLEEYNRNRRSSDGRREACKACTRQRDRELRARTRAAKPAGRPGAPPTVVEFRRHPETRWDSVGGMTRTAKHFSVTRQTIARWAKAGRPSRTLRALDGYEFRVQP